MGIKKAVIDSNVLLALIDKKDKWHSKASGVAEALRADRWEIIYLDCVLNEVVSVLGKRLEERRDPGSFIALMDKLEDLVPEELIEWLYPDVPELFGDIMRLMKDKEGKLSFHDALMSLFVKEQGLSHIISFDADFDEIPWITRISHEATIE
jgi:predicted nucleic acid-binding protein